MRLIMTHLQKDEEYTYAYLPDNAKDGEKVVLKNENESGAWTIIGKTPSCYIQVGEK